MIMEQIIYKILFIKFTKKRKYNCSLKVHIIKIVLQISLELYADKDDFVNNRKISI